MVFAPASMVLRILSSLLPPLAIIGTSGYFPPNYFDHVRRSFSGRHIQDGDSGIQSHSDVLIFVHHSRNDRYIQNTFYESDVLVLLIGEFTITPKAP